MLWVKAYQGEVLGEALFGRIADQLDDEEHTAKMRVLATLERRTKEAIAPALERAGLSTEPDPEIPGARRRPGRAAATPWDDLLATFEPITSQFSAMYRRIGELDPVRARDVRAAGRARARAAQLRPGRNWRATPTTSLDADQRPGAHAVSGSPGRPSRPEAPKRPQKPRPAALGRDPAWNPGPTPPTMVGKAMAPVVHFRAAVALAGRFPALAGVDLSLDQGEVVVVMGPNGAGKTSLLRACAGLLPGHLG